jgi:phosphoglycolate phosphatase/pyrophosphatase PpaX
MRRYNLSPDEILMVDDLKPGYDMARGAGVPFAAATWAYDVPEIAAFMREHCDYYLSSVDDLKKLLFGAE